MYKVLIIDDELWSREVVKSLGEWESMDLTVVGEAENGAEGLRMVAQMEPDIVISDMRMPGIEGVELLKMFDERFPSLKVIIMSGYDDFVYLKQAIHSRVIEYLLKPIKPEELNAALAQCVQDLEQAHLATDISWQMPLLFADIDILDKYLTYRQQVFGYLLEMNKAAVLHEFEKLGTFLESALFQIQDRNIMSKIRRDFILILEEFISENGISFCSIWKDRDREEILMASTGDSVADAVADISRLYGEAINAADACRKNKRHISIEEVQDYIARHFQDPISLNTIARHFFISKEHLSRKFKNSTGENLSDYIFRSRMEKARALILGQKVEIKHVAQMTGYVDIAYFYRVFKGHFGVTPGELRKDP